MAIKIHCSALPGYADCPRRNACSPWMLRNEIIEAGFVLRDERKGIGATVGKSVHAGANETMLEKVKTGGNPCSESRAVDRAIVEYCSNVPDNDFDATTPDQTTGERQVIRQTRAYYNLVAPKINPFFTEQRYSADLGNGFYLTGQPDVLEQGGNLRDAKCGSVFRDCRAQGGGYGVLLRANKMEIAGFDVDFIPRVKIQKPQAAPETHTYVIAEAEKTAWFLIKKILADISEFRKTKNPWSLSANPMSMLCGEKYCSAYGTEFCEFKKEAKK